MESIVKFETEISTSISYRSFEQLKITAD